MAKANPRTAPADDEDVHVQDYELHSGHTQTARYKAVAVAGDVPIIRDVYISRLDMPDPRNPPKRVRIAVKFL